MNQISEEKRDDLEKKLAEATKEITDHVVEINQTLKKSGVPTIILPTFPVSVSVNASNAKFSGSIDNSIASILASNSIHEVKRGGFFGSILDFFSTKTEVDIVQFRRSLAREVKKIGQAEIERVFRDLSDEVRDSIDDTFDGFQRSCDEAGDIYQKIFSNTLYDISVVLDDTGKKKDELDRNIATLRDINQNMQPYFKIWSDIRGEQE